MECGYKCCLLPEIHWQTIILKYSWFAKLNDTKCDIIDVLRMYLGGRGLKYHIDVKIDT